MKESVATQCLTLKQLKERKNFLLREIEKIDEIISYRESMKQESAPLYPPIEIVRERVLPPFILPTEKVDKFELEEKKLTEEKSGAIKALMNLAQKSIKSGIEEYEKKRVKKVPIKKEVVEEESTPPPPPIPPLEEAEEVEIKKKVKKLPTSKSFKSYSQELNPILRDVWSKD